MNQVLCGGQKQMFNKKGEANDANIPAVMLYYMLASFLLVMLIFGFASIVTGWQTQVAHYPEELKGESIAMRFTQNPDCFAYEDPVSGRVYEGVIDLSKFTQGQLNSCYVTGDDGHEYFQFELVLEDYDTKLLTDNKYVNVVDFTIKKNVLVYTEGTFTPSVLFIYVQEMI